MVLIRKFCPHAILVVLCSSLVVAASARDVVIKRPYYELSYNEAHEVANWVSYTLETSQLKNCTKRNNSFKPDPLVPTGSAVLEDYKNSGYDRGHLLPAGDMKFNAQAMSDTFYLSNIAPQTARFNRGLWASLENLVRAWALKYKKIWIVTGPVLHSGLATMGRINQISVADEYYKVILRKDDRGSYRGVGIIMQSSLPYPYLNAYAMDINAVEKITGLDFFPFLTHEEEREAEGNFENMFWDFKAEFDYLPCSSSVAQ